MKGGFLDVVEEESGRNCEGKASECGAFPFSEINFSSGRLLGEL